MWPQMWPSDTKAPPYDIVSSAWYVVHIHTPNLLDMWAFVKEAKMNKIVMHCIRRDWIHVRFGVHDVADFKFWGGLCKGFFDIM